MHALMNIVVQGHVAYRSIDDVLSITSHSSNTTPGDPALKRCNINISVVFLSLILDSLFTFKICTKLDDADFRCKY